MLSAFALCTITVLTTALPLVAKAGLSLQGPFSLFIKLYMFGRKRRQADMLAAIQASLPAMTEAIKQALEPAKPKLSEAGDFYASSLGAMSTFLAGAQDLALKGAASQLGQRGGRKTQAKRKAAAALAARQAQGGADCPLCRDSHARNLTVEIIQEHRRHEYGRANPIPTNETGEERNGSGLLAGQAIGFSPPDDTR